MVEFQLHPPWFLLPDAKQVDVPELVWKLEEKVETTPEKWGWLGKVCVVCGEPAEYWDLLNGYRCIVHFPVSGPIPLPAGGYAGDVDASGEYEHDW